MSCGAQPGRDARRSAKRRWQKSPVTGESTKETVKTIVQGMPADAVYPWLLTRVLFVAHAASGATRIRHSLRPLGFRGWFDPITRTHACRENEESRLSPLSCSAKAGHPVRRDLSAESQPPLEYWIARSSPIESGTGAGRRRRREWLFEIRIGNAQDFVVAKAVCGQGPTDRFRGMGPRFRGD